MSLIMSSEIAESSRRFYDAQVAPMIRARFPEYEDRIAVGLAGEGSDCFGYDDLLSRDHDFGTGVCLWLTDEDYAAFGAALTDAYNELAYVQAGGELTKRLKERRGVMTIRRFYSNILQIDCDTEHCTMSEEQWRSLDHTCLATAVNGRVYRDDPGVFSAFRALLKSYYPDRIWRERIAQELHAFSAALQVNYARCMTRGDIVAAQICKARGLEAAMQLFFLLKRKYAPYYKWTFRALEKFDHAKLFAPLIQALAEAQPVPAVWEKEGYHPNRLNTEDPVVVCAEKIAAEVVCLLRTHRMDNGGDPYLEEHVDTVLQISSN